jgi:hypothetical protein
MGRTRLTQVALTVAVSSAAAGSAAAGQVQFQLGEQDFADGTSPVLSSRIRAAGAGEQYPFDGSIFGSDVQRSLGAFEYAHGFDLRGATALYATLTIGLVDLDSPAAAAGAAALDTVGLTLDGFALAPGILAGLSAAGSPSSAEVIDIPVPVELLADGSLTVGVFAKRPGPGNLGNAIEADFSRLVVETDRDTPPDWTDPPPPPPPTNGNGGEGGDDGGSGGGGDPAPIPAVPFPAALWPAGLLLASLIAVPKRVLRRWLRM